MVNNISRGKSVHCQQYKQKIALAIRSSVRVRCNFLLQRKYLVFFVVIEPQKENPDSIYIPYHATLCFFNFPKTNMCMYLCMYHVYTRTFVYYFLRITEACSRLQWIFSYLLWSVRNIDQRIEREHVNQRKTFFIRIQFIMNFFQKSR